MLYLSVPQTNRDSLTAGEGDDWYRNKRESPTHQTVDGAQILVYG